MYSEEDFAIAVAWRTGDKAEAARLLALKAKRIRLETEKYLWRKWRWVIIPLFIVWLATGAWLVLYGVMP